ncbi:EKA-like protein [Blumeria hordei DH14]|uniref:EKA-like protein n=1 Tax=Blumeria graminis f. sp. hordei (strain DH14) TaxID=546991 RepID=N1JD44_BLUG1|nr:EKA-like protein [Blumeria hordei DH14]
MDISNAEDVITTKVMDAPEIEMIDRAVNELVTKGLSDTIWAALINSGSSEPTHQTEKLILSPNTPRLSATSSRRSQPYSQGCRKLTKSPWPHPMPPVMNPWKEGVM